ncbi:MAG: AsnC family transcriptional regulator [Magnetococcales bacterium]|nr:AsnC family transcriptional regulator [Magnetococcales bacterium]
MTTLDYRLLNEFQHDFPMVPQPYLEMARRLEVDEAFVLERLRILKQKGLISRVGVVLQPRRVGASTLAAMRVPEAQLETVADLVSGFAEVNHNYQREHDFNLWFVMTAVNQARLDEIVLEIEMLTGLTVFSMPMEESFHIDLGFHIH